LREGLRNHAVLGAAGLLIAADFVAVMLRRRRQLGDFDVSMEFGRRFASGQPLSQGGLHFPYLPTAAMFFAPFSMLPRPLAFLLFYMLAFICLVLVYRRLTAMVCNARPVLRQRRWAVAIVSLILASHYIIRDLDDGGPNIVLLALATGGIYLARSGREVAAGGFLGAAIAFKATAGGFIPFLLWKRRRDAALRDLRPSAEPRGARQGALPRSDGLPPSNAVHGC
jgi:Glycosyltransferase family 87